MRSSTNGWRAPQKWSCTRAPRGGASSSTGRAQHEVVVVGGGFGGLQAVRHLRRAPVSITLVDRRSFHLFQPLVYQVATGMLAAGEIAAPLRSVFKRDRNVRVILGEVCGFDLGGRRVLLERLPNGDPERELTYDSLIVAAGSHYTYFGHDEWRAVAPDVKSLESALVVRGRILTAFEAAEVEEDPGRRAAWLTFVVVGAGPTGVELAGQIAEMARHALRDEYRAADMRSARIVLVEMADRVLPMFPPTLSDRARRELEHLGVEPVIGHRVVDVDEDCVTVSPAAGGVPMQIPARTAVWTAGVVATALATALATESGAQLDRGGRVAVGPDLTVAGHPEVLALGDMARVHDGQGRPVPLPGLAPVAMQQGRHAARVIGNRLSGRQTPPFRYRDKGSLATIGRAKAVAEIRRLRLSGLPAWLAWLLVHLFYLIGLQNRLLVLVRWMFSYLTRSGGARLITGSEVTLAQRTPTTAGEAGRRR
jgi:NADH:quinone reductase (non-electrogenic)